MKKLMAKFEFIIYPTIITYLKKLIFKEWEIANIKDIIKAWEIEHAKSLAILFENEAQKLLLEELNTKLSESIRINERDMKMAEKVQQSLLIQSPPQTSNFEIAFYYEPFAAVSGDFYDFYVNENNLLEGVVVADVSGHGIASSLFTALVKPVFFRTFKRNSMDPLNIIMSKINRQLIEDMVGTDNFLTSAVMRFKEDAVEYISAAHPDIIHKSWTDNSCNYVGSEKDPIQSQLLGLASLEMPFEVYPFKIKKGDVLVLYTDCLIESRNLKNIPFGSDVLLNILNSMPSNSTCQKILDEILTFFKAHINYHPLTDDLTMIVLKKK